MRIKPLISRYDIQDGFEQYQGHNQSLLDMQSHLHSGYSMPLHKQKKRNRSPSRKQQAKLRFISIERQKSHSSHYEYLKEEQAQSIHKSLTLDKEQQASFNIKNRKKITGKSKKLLPIQSFKNSVIKIKRSQIGENIQLKQYNSDEVKAIKNRLINAGASLVFQENRETNSHGLFKKLLKQKIFNGFLRSKYNCALLEKLNQSYIHPKNDNSSKINHLGSKKTLEFISDFQSSNLDFVTQINPFEYDLYIKADTNTMGHQNWFYFKLLNNSQQKKPIFLNMCNLKRGFKMVKKGQKIYRRFKKIMPSQIKTSIQNQQQQWTEWQKIEEDVSVALNEEVSQRDNLKKKKTYRLSFSASLQSKTQYEFSLLPPFSYSAMLKEVQCIQKTCKEAHVQILTFSLLGLAIPIVTFNNKQVENKHKKIILISSRIHPGQTCGSFVVSGILKKLAFQIKQNPHFMENYIIKIIPMLNPDGVVLGNFRTNYLGNDLNRSFNQQNDAIFPEVTGLKQLGKKLKQDFKQRFLCFLDLHGHSSQKNIFVYGPNYDQNHKNYLNSRFLPKTLSYLADQFDYEKCTFTLQESKSNTARGFFISTLKVMAFTIQSSYALFDSNKDQNLKNLDLKVQNWRLFGQNMINGLELWAKQMQLTSLERKPKVKLTQKNTKQDGDNNQNGDQDILVIGRLRKQIKKQILLQRKKIKQKKNSQSQQDSQAQDSDGQNESQDIPEKERVRLQKKFVQGNAAHLFPRILRPAIIHPEVTPPNPAPLLSVSKIGTMGSKLNPLNNSVINGRIKRNRYQNIKPVNVNNAYTQYLLKQVKGLQSLRPSVNLMKLQRKQSSLIHSANTSIKQLSLNKMGNL